MERHGGIESLIGGMLIRTAKGEQEVGGTVLALSHIEVWEFTLL